MSEVKKLPSRQRPGKPKKKKDAVTTKSEKEEVRSSKIVPAKLRTNEKKVTELSKGVPWDTKKYSHTRRNPNAATVEQLGMAVAAPEDTFPIRLNTEGSSKTAIFKVKNNFSVQFATANNVCPIGQFSVFKFRDILRSTVYYNPINVAWSYNCVGQFLTGSNTYVAPSAIFAYSCTTLNVDALASPLIAHYQSTSSSVAPHGQNLFTGFSMDTNYNYVWCNAADSLTVIPITLSGSYNFQSHLWANKNDTQPKAGNLSSLTNLVLKASGEAAGYYAWSITGKTTGTVTFTVQLACAALAAPGGGYFQQCAIPNLLGVLPRVQSYRVNAYSMRLTNGAPFNARGGYCAAAQIPKGTLWTSYTNIGSGTADPFGLLCSQSDSTAQADATGGLYGYGRPSELNDFIYQDHITSIAGTLVQASFPLAPTSDYLAMILNVTSTPGQVFTANECTHVEYKTTDPTIDTDIAMTTSQTHNDLMELLKFTPQFTENPAHWADLWKSIREVAKKVVTGVTEYGPSILKFASNASALI